MKKLLSLLMVCTMMFICLGCGSKNNGSANGQTKVFASLSHKDTFISTIVDEMVSYSQSNNIKLDIEEADNNIETQVEQVKKAKEKGYDSIVCLLVDADTSEQIINIAGEIPVIFINVEPDGDRLVPNKDIYVASNEQEVVDSTAKYFEEYFKNNKSFDAVLFEGDRNCKSTLMRTNTLKSELKKKSFNINYVFQDEAHWDRQEAKEMFKIFLKLNKHYDCVICNNDEMAVGVIEAMEEENIDPSSVPIFGVDAITDACKEILDGKMLFTMKQSGKGQGEYAMKAAEAMKKGEDIRTLEYADESGKYIWYPYSAVDKSNVLEYINQ
ncbi:MAG: substrate-binding domain-containing protein [Clostridium sp.]